MVIAPSPQPRPAPRARALPPETVVQEGQNCTPIWSAPLELHRITGGFYFLPGMVILELRGAQVAERGVQPASVVDLVNEAGKIRGDVLECFVVHQVDGFDLQRLDEFFGLGVRLGISAPAHRAGEPVLCEQLAVIARLNQTTSRVMNRQRFMSLPYLGSLLSNCCATCIMSSLR